MVPELFSLEIEEALVGSVLINPEAYLSLDVQPEHFYVHRLRYVWQAIGALHQRGIAVDFVTVTEELDRAGKLAEIGGPAYLSGLLGSTPTSLHAADYAVSVKDYARRRTWKELASRIAQLSHDQQANLELEAGNIVNDLLSAVKPSGSASPISEYTQRVLTETFERVNDPRECWGIPTGFLDFDNITGGIQLSETLYVSGEPGVGKSIFAMQAGFQMAENGHPGVIYSLEMPGAQVIRRRGSALAKVPTRAIKSGNLTSEQLDGFVAALDKIAALPLYMSDTVQWTTVGLRADLVRLKARVNIEWFVLDYAYLLQDGRDLSENDRTGYISSQIKNICRSLNLAGLVIHSLNKSGMGNAPSGANLRGSGQQFYDTDLLLFLMKNPDNPSVVTCTFGKGRELENPRQSFDLLKLDGYPAFGNIAHRQPNAQRLPSKNGNGALQPIPF